MFKKLDLVKNSLFEVELGKAQIEHKKADHFRVFHSSKRKAASFGAVPHFFHKRLWCQQLRGVLSGHRFAVSCACREKFGRLYQTWNERGMAEVTIEWPSRLFHCWCCSKFLPPNMLCKTQTTWWESLASSGKDSDVRGCYVCVIRHTVAMTSPLITLTLAVKIWTNVYLNRAATEHWKSIVESWTKK